MSPRPNSSFFAGLRALRRGRIIARALLDLLPPPARPAIPFFLRLFLGRAGKKRLGLEERLRRWGPSYIKLGQLLATRPDIIGEEAAERLQQLQDKMPPFSQGQALAAIREEFGQENIFGGENLFISLGPPAAAASIAQVHPGEIFDKTLAKTHDGGKKKKVAVKILRPNIEAIFARDLAGFFQLARWAQLFLPEARRLKLAEVLDHLQALVAAEMDLRLEAASLSELAANSRDDKTGGQTGWHLPRPDWQRSGRRVLTLEWIDGISAGDRAALIRAGHDPKKIARNLMREFLTHALGHGFFHADMHAGNLFVLADGRLAAVDFGIMGRLTPGDRLALARILYSLTRRDYRAAALAHIGAGYVPADINPDIFAHALRAIAEPIFGLPAKDISMARLLARLFETTARFNMETQPGLLLLQKTMLAAEGLARRLDPEFDIWAAAREALTPFSRRALPGPLLRESAEQAGLLLARAPELLAKAQTLLDARGSAAPQKSGRFGGRFWPGLLVGLALAGALGAGLAFSGFPLPSLFAALFAPSG